MASVKLGSKPDSFKKKGQAWYVPICFDFFPLRRSVFLVLFYLFLVSLYGKPLIEFGLARLPWLPW
jgi:hypothetical protein